MINQPNVMGAYLQGRMGGQQYQQNQQAQQQGQQTHQLNQQLGQQRLQAGEQQMQMQRRQEVAQALQWADTPEKWEQAVDWFAQNGSKEAEQFRGRFDLRPMLAQQMGLNLPAGVQEFDAIAQRGQFSEDETAQAARIRAGLAPRAAGGGMQLIKMTGSDGRERAFLLNPQDGSLMPASAQQIQQMGGMGQAQSVQAPEGVQMPVDPFTGRRPEDKPPEGMEWRGEGDERRLVPQAGSPDQRQREASRRARAEMFRGRVEPFVRDALRARDLSGAAGPFAGALVNRGAREDAGLFTQMAAAGMTRDTFELNQHLESLKSNISIEQLQQMRESSPTGGALGQIPVRQQQFLMQMEGSLNPQLRPEVLRENIALVSNNRIRALARAMFGDDEELQEAVMDGRMTAQQAEEAARERDELIQTNLQDQEFQLFPQGGEGNRRQSPRNRSDVPAGVDPEDWQYMTEEQRALWRR